MDHRDLVDRLIAPSIVLVTGLILVAANEAGIGLLLIGAAAGILLPSHATSYLPRGPASRLRRD